MSMIISLLRWSGGAAAALAGWAAVMAAIPFVGPAGRQVAVVGGAADAIVAVAAAGGRVVEVRRGVVIARSDRRDFAARLYRNGARFVIEGRLAGGCLSRR